MLLIILMVVSLIGQAAEPDTLWVDSLLVLLLCPDLFVNPEV